MSTSATILLFVRDRPVLSSLQFALRVEGFEAHDAAAKDSNPLAAAAVVIDHGRHGDGLATLTAVRAQGCTAPAIVLATNPTTRLRLRAAAAGAAVIEKPLHGDELVQAIRSALQTRKAA